MDVHSNLKKLIPEVTKLAYTKISEIAISHRGTIYGGFVRDRIISDHYTSLYKNDHTYDIDCIDMGKFWDKDYHPQTISRLLLPVDMDVCFSKVDAVYFIDKLRNMSEFQNVSVTDITHNAVYYSPFIERINKITLTMIIGEIPFLSKGQMITLHIDVIVPKDYIMMQPPFKNLDMLCNGFVMTKNGISLSTHTGTAIDDYTFFEKNVVVIDILKDLVNFKTHLCFQFVTHEWSFNLMAMKRIEKMHNKGLGWKFVNLPFKTDIYDKCKTSITDCCICCDEFIQNDYIAKAELKIKDENITSSTMHYECCIKYLKHQCREYKEKILEEKFMLRCPMRNQIDFSTCILDIKRDFDPYKN